MIRSVELPVKETDAVPPLFQFTSNEQTEETFCDAAIAEEI